jgi:hypothetical protein
MGIPFLGWMEEVIGDPLMAAHAGHPTVAFVDPTPQSNAQITGDVSLYATASTDGGGGSIQRVEFWVNNTSGFSTRICTDYQAPYECSWDTLQLSGGNRIYPNGSYTIKAVAYQEGNVVGMSSISREVTVDSSEVPSISITQPSTEGTIVTVATPVEANAGGTPTKVEFWLFGVENVIKAGEDTASPYQCSISSSIADDGVYQLHAVAYYGSTPDASYTTRRRINLLNDYSAFSSVASLGSVADETNLYLVDLPVIAGTTLSMDGAFYLEDSYRAAGIRVKQHSQYKLAGWSQFRGFFIVTQTLQSVMLRQPKYGIRVLSLRLRHSACKTNRSAVRHQPEHRELVAVLVYTMSACWPRLLEE